MKKLLLLLVIISTLSANPLQKPWHVSAFGGASLAPSSHSTVSGYDLGSSSLSTKSDFGGLAGLKLGHDFPTLTNLGDLTIYPSLEIESFYTRFTHSGTIDSFPGVGLSTLIDLVNISLNPITRFNYKQFSPYLGFGAGLAIVSTNGTNGTGLASGLIQRQSANDIAPSIQAIGGLSYAINPSWSIFTEYKFLTVFNPQIGSNSESDLQIDMDNLGLHIVATGVKFNF